MATKAKKYISDTNLKRAQPGDVLWDKQITGLHIRVMPTGKRKFYMYYRTPLGKERRPALKNIHTLEDARYLVAKLKMELLKGNDPADIMRDQILMAAQREGIPTVAELCDEFLEENGAKYKRLSNAEQSIRLYIKPKLGLISSKDLTLEHVEQTHKDMEDTPYAANRMLALLSKILNYAEKKRYREYNSNFIRLIDKYKEQSRERYIEAEEATRIAEALKYYSPEAPFAVAFIVFAIMTGARRSEISAAKWKHIKGNKLVLDEHKTDHTGKKRVIVLAPIVLDFLNKLPRTVPSRGRQAANKRNRLEQGYIFAIASPDKLWQKVRARADVEDLRIHDLRHSFASGGIAADVSLDKVGGLLSHESEQTTKRYTHLIEGPALEAATDTVAFLDNMMGGVMGKLTETLDEV